jgi:1-acyl-sn-glycerol-3-phosphate acyltransferase
MFKFLRIVRPALMFTVLVSAFLLAVFSSLLKRLGIYIDYTVMKYWARVTCRIYGIKIKREGDSNNTPAIIVADHVSYWDILTMSATFSGFFVSKASVKNWPFIGWGARFVRTIFIVRENKARAIETLNKEAKKLIEQKESVFMFAEGTTSLNPCKPFKNGAFHMSRETNTPIKPVALYYDRMDIIRWIDNDSFVPHLAGMTFTPGINCYVYEYPLIYPKDFKSIDEMKTYCQNIIQKKLDEYKDRFGKGA